MKKDYQKNQPKDTMVRKHLSVEEKEKIKQFILFKADEPINEKGSDGQLDIQLEKIELLSGQTITRKEIDDIVATAVQPYEPKYTRESGFYRQMYKLLGKPIHEADQFVKDPIIAKYTNELIYDRFPNEVLPLLQELNPYVRHRMRKYKLFQFLTEPASQKVDEFIKQATDLMEEHNKKGSNWYRFRIDYWKKYGGSIQLKCFEDNSNV